MTTQEPLLKSINIGGKEFKWNRDLGVAPYFTWKLRKRVRQKKACNVVVTGEAGEGKSYTAQQIARNIDPTFGAITKRYRKLDPEFILPQVVFSYKNYLDVLLKLPMGKPIVFDEPSYAMGKREWYKQVNQALVKTIESQRFLVKPLIIPIINTSLLDKTIRSYLIQFMVVMHDRGKGVVYRFQASQFQDKVYRKFVCRIKYGLMDNDKCNRDTCLDCKKIDDCMLLRARYEKKKQSIKMDRYQDDLEAATTRESERMTLEQLAEVVMPFFKDYTIDMKINVTKMKILLRERKGIRIGKNKSYDLRTLLEMKYPELFTIKPIIQ